MNIQSQMTVLLKRLCAINSHSHNPEGSKAVLKILKKEFGKLGFRPTIFKARSGHEHAFFKIPGSKPSILLLGHVDTVYSKASNFQRAIQKGTRIWGPGVLDMKGGLIAILFGLKVVPKSLLRNIAIFLNSDEEIGSSSSFPFLLKCARGFKTALVFEFGRKNGDIVVARKGSASLTINVEGRAAHAGNAHQDGRSAVLELAHKIIQLEALTDYNKGITLNVGIVRGGESKNSVPDKAEAIIDIRFVHEKDGRRVYQQIRRLLSKPSVPGTRTLISKFYLRPAMVPNPKSLRLANAYAQILRQFGEPSGKAALQGGASDAAFLSQLRIPVIDGLGPEGEGAHTAHKEFIYTKSLILKANALATFLLRY